jgi:mannose-6-phosphate isomerase-like protein (cupin superfamily)
MTTTDQTERMTPFKYEPPEIPPDRGKVSVNLYRTDIAGFTIQRAVKGLGEPNMPAHTAADSNWFVLAGEVEFYGYGDVLIAKLGKHEGLTIPRGVPYWFKAISDEPLEIIHASGRTSEVKSERVNYRPILEHMKNLGGREATKDEKVWAGQVARDSAAQ